MDMNYVIDSSTRFQVSQKMFFDVIDVLPQGFVKGEELFHFVTLLLHLASFTDKELNKSLVLDSDWLNNISV